MFSGTIPALITPFRRVGDSTEIDFATLDNLIQWQLDCGVNGIVACGTTAESVTLTVKEQDEVLKRTIAKVAGKVPVIMGTGTNDTAKSIERTISAAELGADAALVVVPYYNKPTQEGLYQHFKAIADASPIPIVLYNVPSRTVASIDISTIVRLAEHPKIVAVKEATDSLTRIFAICDAVANKIDVLAGSCEATATMMGLGGTGVISASANAIPEMMVAITNAAAAGNFQEANRLQQAAMPYIDVLFCESNPIPAKAALGMLGRLPDESLRLPLVSASEVARAKIEKFFQGAR